MSLLTIGGMKRGVTLAITRWLEHRRFARPSSPIDTRRRAVIVLLTIILCLGAANRIIHFSQGRVLYNDEIYVAENIRKLSSAELRGPLIHDQRAPVGFLLAVKACWVTIGHNDYALRAVPLIGGLLGLLAFYPVARTFLPPTAALFALALFAGSEPLVFYSAELKPYAWDATATIVILGILIPLATRPLTWTYALVAGAAGMCLPFMSFASTFTMASMGGVLAACLISQRRWVEIPKAAAMGALWGLGILALYLIQVRHYPKDISSWIWSWGNEFGCFPLFGHYSRIWFQDHLNQLISHSVGLSVSTLAILAVVMGVLYLARLRPFILSLFLMPILTGIVMSHMKQYPFSGRMLLYTYPIIILLIAYAINRLWESSESESRRWAIGAMALLLAPMIFAGINNARNPRERSSVAYTNYDQAHIKYAMQFIQKNWQPGDLLYLQSDSGKWVQHYAEKYGFDPQTAIAGIPSHLWCTNWEACGEHLEKTVKGKPRVWLLITHQTGIAINEVFMYRYYLNKIGRCLMAYDPGYNTSGHAYLYDLTGK